MLYVTSLPHAQSPQMQRTIFLCFPCNRTWSYMLSAALAEGYRRQAEGAVPA
jgi:hypothetical protein